MNVRAVEAPDTARDRVFPVEIWSPEGAPGIPPLVLFSHASGHHRRGAAFLCTHLASHGYLVAAMDHSEVVAKGMGVDDVIAGRVPDLRFLLDWMLREERLDAARIGIVGFSFGGWAALATPETDERVGAVVALAPGGASKRKPGILPLSLTFRWRRKVPALYLTAENDVLLPLEGMYEIFARAPEPKQMMILRRADHGHFKDAVEEEHEALRGMKWTAGLEWIAREMRPITELCSGEQAHVFVRGLTAAHMDAALRQHDAARRFLASDLERELAARGVEAMAYRGQGSVGHP